MAEFIVFTVSEGYRLQDSPRTILDADTADEAAAIVHKRSGNLVDKDYDVLALGDVKRHTVTNQIAINVDSVDGKVTYTKADLEIIEKARVDERIAAQAAADAAADAITAATAVDQLG